jgi:hypothetical protein
MPSGAVRPVAGRGRLEDVQKVLTTRRAIEVSPAVIASV